MLVYVCSSLRPTTVKRVDVILAQFKANVKLDQHLEFFRPNGTDPAKMMDTVREDVNAIEECDELWVVGRFGRDCSWEIGYAMAIGKKIVVWEDHTNTRKLWADWMWRIGLDTGQIRVLQLKEYV